MAASRITRDKMFEPLLVADPYFSSRWADFMAEWGGEDDPPLYLALSSLAEHVLQCLEAERTERFDAILAVVEHSHIDGDAYLSEAASVGLLESLQNSSGGSDRKAVTVERCLGPESKRWWDKLDRFWDGDRQALSSDG